MANTRAINQKASKRQRTGKHTYHDRLVLPDDFEVIHSRQSGLTSRGRVIETPRSPQRGHTAWLLGDTWAPEDNTEVGLEPGWEWCDDVFEGPVTEIMSPLPMKSAKAKRKRPVSTH